jgi:hypothetical protein
MVSALWRASTEEENDDDDDDEEEEELLPLPLPATTIVSDTCGACIRPILSIGGVSHGKGKEKPGAILPNNLESEFSA